MENKTEENKTEEIKNEEPPRRPRGRPRKIKPETPPKTKFGRGPNMSARYSVFAWNSEKNDWDFIGLFASYTAISKRLDLTYPIVQNIFLRKSYYHRFFR